MRSQLRYCCIAMQLNVFTRKMRITENCRVKSKLFFSCLTKLLPLGLKQILQLSTFPCVFVMFVFSPPLCSSMFSFIVSCFHFSLSKCIVVWSSGSKWASFVSFFASMPFLASGSSSETFLCMEVSTILHASMNLRRNKFGSRNFLKLSLKL